MLQELRQAIENDEMVDLSAVVNASDMGRVKTVRILNDLFQRKLEEKERSRDIGSQYTSHADQGRQPTGPIPVVQGPSRSQPMGRAWTVQSTDTASSPKSPESKGAIFMRKLLPSRSRSGQDDNDDNNNQVAIQARSPPEGGSAYENEMRQTQTHDPNSLIRNPWASTSGGNADESNRFPPQRKSSQPSVPIQHSIQHSRTSSTPKSSISSPPNDYAGFCKGAYYLQVRLRNDGVKLKNGSSSMTGENYYYACSSSKCCFEGRAVKTSKGWDFDHTMHLDPNGLVYRWSFLAKSHVSQGSAKYRRYQYRCIFCALGGADAPSFHGIAALLEHVSQHRNDELGSDRVIMDTGHFDLKFLEGDQPADVQSLRSSLDVSLDVQEDATWSEISDDHNPWRLEDV